MNKNLFTLVIGHARSGTSLCAGLLNESPEINVGFEINNLNLVDGERDRSEKKEFSENLTGNKICVFHNLNCEKMLGSIEEKKCIMHNKWNKLKIIFTKRNVISSMVSRRRRELGKGKPAGFESIVKSHALSEKKIISLKKHFGDYFVFDFDKAIFSWEYVGKMFEYINVKYEKKYFTEFKNIKNYRYGGGVSPSYVQFGMPEKCEEDRLKFEQLIRLYEPWLLNE